MRVPVTTYVVVAALVTLSFAAGCGDANDTNITLGDEPTPTAATPARTATPGTATTAARTATPVDGVTETPSPAATPTTSGTEPTATATPGGAVDPDAQLVLAQDFLPFLLLAPSAMTGGSVSALSTSSLTAAEADTVDDCPDGGTRTDDEGIPERNITLDACDVTVPQLGSFEIDGDITITFGLTTATIDFDFTITDLATDHTVEFFDPLTATLQGGGFVLNGPMEVDTDEGTFTLNLDNVTIDSNHNLVSGSGTATGFQDFPENFGVSMVAMTIADGGQTANFTVTFTDASVHTYALDLQTGELTQTS
jgi:hypothetical protein